MSSSEKIMLIETALKSRIQTIAALPDPDGNPYLPKMTINGLIFDREVFDGGLLMPYIRIYPQRAANLDIEPFAHREYWNFAYDIVVFSNPYLWTEVNVREYAAWIGEKLLEQRNLGISPDPGIDMKRMELKNKWTDDLPSAICRAASVSILIRCPIKED